MYAVIESGGKQYRVEVGTELEVDHLAQDAGDTIEFERVCCRRRDEAASASVVRGSARERELVRHTARRKIVVFKYNQGP